MSRLIDFFEYTNINKFLYVYTLVPYFTQLLCSTKILRKLKPRILTLDFHELGSKETKN